MSTVQKIEWAVKRPNDSDLGHLSGWLEDYLAEKWERRFAADCAFGQGQCRPL